TVTSSVAVTDAPLSSTAAPTIATTEGQAVSNVLVATFTDADPNGVPADYVATIDWGDGQTSAGTVAFLGFTPQDPQFSVKGSHVYREEGSYNASAVITDTDGGPITPDRSTTTSPNTPVTVADAPLTATAAVLPGMTEGLSSGTITVATFTDADPNG